MILALDPGSVKTGVAVVYKNGSLARKKVIQTEDFENLKSPDDTTKFKSRIRIMPS